MIRKHAGFGFIPAGLAAQFAYSLKGSMPSEWRLLQGVAEMPTSVTRIASCLVAMGWLMLAIHAMPARAAGSKADDEGERAFLAENGSAMTAMMRRMEITPSGNIDRDFVAMMAPHHQGAIDMAQAYLRFGHNEQLRRLAQEIIVEQQQEILAMRLAVGLPLPPPVAAPTDTGGPPAIPVPVEDAHREGGERVLPLHGHQPEQLQESR